MTVRHAVRNLQAQGLVHRVQGLGTFISPPRLAQPVSLSSFTEDLRARGIAPSSLLLAHDVVPAGEELAPALEIAPSDQVVRIDRVRLGDGEPIAIERAHLPLRRFPGLDRVELTEGSLYELLADRYGCIIGSSRQRIAAVSLTAADAHLLHTQPMTPALRIERITRSSDDTVIEVARSLYRGDRYELHTEQRRGTGH